MKTAFTIAIALALVAGGCRPKTETLSWGQRPILEARMQEQVRYFRELDPTIGRFFDDSNGVIVFGSIYKAPGFSGGLFGRGQAFECGRIAGYSAIFQQTGNFTVSSPHFREIIFLKSKTDFEIYKQQGLIILGPPNIGIALSGGASAKADYVNGKAVFVMCDAGSMDDIPLEHQIVNYVSIP